MAVVARKLSKLLKVAQDERGSISLLVGGLFIITVALVVTLTNIAGVAIAKKSLTQATESAAQFGSSALNQNSYYQGEFNEITMVESLIGLGPDDPGVPIDCNEAASRVEIAMSDWAGSGISLKRVEIDSLQIDSLECDGFELTLSTTARARLAFVLPFFNLKDVEIHSTVGSTNERREGLYLFGFRIA